MNNKLAKALLSFCSEDQHRPYSKPVVFDNKAYFTDAHILVFSEIKSIPESAIESVSDFDPGKIVSAINTLNKKALITYTVEDAPVIELTRLQNELDHFEHGNIYYECECCEGTGEVECPMCGHEHECSECNGSGNSKKVKQENKILPKTINTIIFEWIGIECFVDPSKFEKVLDFQKNVESEMKIISMSKDFISLQIGDFSVYLFGLGSNNLNDYMYIRRYGI